MTAQQHRKRLPDLLHEPLAGSGRPQPESAQQEPWQDQLESLRQWICELLIENQRLRTSVGTTASPL